MTLVLAFQIADDLLDLKSSPEALGKATQKDLQRGKATIASLMGRGGGGMKAGRIGGVGHCGTGALTEKRQKPARGGALYSFAEELVFSPSGF